MKTSLNLFAILSILFALTLSSCGDDEDGDPDKGGGDDGSPAITDQSFSVDEFSAVDTEVGTVAATDPDGDAITFTISAGNDGGVFQINTTSGLITVAANDNLVNSINASFNLTVAASDGTNTSSAMITITVDEVGVISGKVDGVDYTYKYANAQLNSVDEVYDVRLYSTAQTESNPCGIIESGNAHIRIQIDATTDVTTFPTDILSKTPRFEFEGGGNEGERASSGFIRIVSISGSTITGYLEARIDDSNDVKGKFTMESCN
ncbi:MAG: cadherin repeat domain-containing protein [Cyclobacteriaceae bacterium]|nr:cadherin repeat domain-containing protein [Cyclobacteriaceae bacterium HetDA_MAG_MS6]